MSKFDLPKKGDYVTIHDGSNFKTTYIVIDPLFAECDFTRPGWKDKIRKD